MAARTANVKGIKIIEEPLGSENVGIALVTFDFINQVVTGGADTVTLGGGGFDAGAASTDTLAVMMQKRRRDGKTVTILDFACGFFGQQTQSSVETKIYPQRASGSVSGGNIIGITLNTAPTAGSSQTANSGAWDSAAGVYVTYKAA